MILDRRGRAARVVVAVVALLVLVRAHLAAAPQPAIVRGTVTDAATGEPVPGVPVAIGATLTFTDEHGRYQLEVAPGPHTLTITADYLQPVSRAVTAPATIDLAVTFDLDGGEQVLVEDSAPITAGLHTIDAANAARQAGTGGDALKAATSAPGVARGSAGNRELVIWGASPHDTRILVDDVPVPALYHLGGWRSIVPTELVASLAIDRAGFATPWSGATGGLVRVHTRTLSVERSLTVAIDPIDTGAVGVTSLGPARVALGARASYLDRTIGALLDDRVRDRIPIPRWADGQLVVQVPRGDDRFDLLVIGGGDRLARTLPALDPAATKRDQRREDVGRLAVGWRRRLPDGEARARLWFGLDRTTRDQAFGPVPATARDHTRSLGARAERQTTVGPVVVLAGVDASLAHDRLARAGSLSIPTREGDVSVFGQPPGDDVATDAWSALTGDVGAYLQTDVVRDGFAVSPGLRVDAWTLGASRVTPKLGTTPGIGWQTVELTVDPRLAARVRRGAISLAGAVGRYHQPRRAEDTSAVFGTPTLGVEAAWHAAGTVALALPGADVELTVWGRRTRSLVARDPSATPPRAATLTQDGRGRALGVELVARLRGWRGLSGWLAYGLSSSERRDHDLVDWRRFEHDQTHQLTIAATWERGPWAVSARGRYATGEPRTDVIGAFWNSRDGRYQPLTGPIYGLRLPAFVQLDLHGERAFTVAGDRVSMFVEVENVTGRANAEEVVWSGDYATRGYLTGLPLLALAGIRWTR